MDGPSILRGIHDSMKRPLGSEEAWFIAACGSALITLLLIHVLVMHVRRRRRVLIRWQEFSARLPRWQLTGGESELLGELARRESLDNPLAVAQADAFELAVHRYLSSESGRKTPNERLAEGRRIRALRRKLGLEVKAGSAYVSTRQFRQGGKVQLQLPGSSGAAQVQAEVGDRREDVLVLAKLDRGDGLTRGLKVTGLLFDSGRSYAFESQVVDARRAPAECLLAHSVDLRPAGSREFHRVSAGMPVHVRAAWEAPDVARGARMSNLSAGGAALVAPCYYEEGEGLVIRIDPGAIPGAHADDAMAARDLNGLAVRVQQQADNECEYHVEFRDTSADDRQYLLRLVRMLEIGTKEGALKE